MTMRGERAFPCSSGRLKGFARDFRTFLGVPTREREYTQRANLNAVEQRFTMNSCFAAERYDVTPLPFIPFSNTGGEALNNNGVVAGGIANSDGSVSLAEWSKGVLTNLGVPPGLPSHELNTPRVFGINACGTAVGTIPTSAGALPPRWFV